MGFRLGTHDVKDDRDTILIVVTDDALVSVSSIGFNDAAGFSGGTC